MQGPAVLKIGNSRLTRPFGSERQIDVNGNLSNGSANGVPVSLHLQRAIERAGRDFRSDTVTVPTQPVMDVRKLLFRKGTRADTCA